jgi:ketosteroid isomerase-like protein
MGEARQVMDAVTEAVFQKDLEAAANLYAPDAVMATPDQGELRGREQIIGYLKQFNNAFPDNRYEPAYAHESGDTAIDEGYFVGTNTAPLPLPTGEELPATGKQVRVRACDIATVQNGVITSHRFYFDQMDFLGQLGLLPETPS